MPDQQKLADVRWKKTGWSSYLGNLCDGESAGVGGKDGVRSHMLLHLLHHLVLDSQVLEDRLDHHVHLVEF